MSVDVLDKARGDLDEALERASLFTERDDFSPDDDAYKSLLADADAKQRSYEAIADVHNRRAAANTVSAAVQRGEKSRSEARQREQSAPEKLSMGEQFVRSDVFGSYPGRGTSSRFEIKERALPLGLADFGGVLAPPVPRDVSAPDGVYSLLNLIPGIPVSSNSVETVVWAKSTGGAAVVPEKGAKPATEFAPTVTPLTLDTIATYTQLTRQLIEDAPAVRARIDQLLAREVRIKEESEAAAALVAATLPTASGADLLAAIRVGMATVEAEGYSPNAVLLNPADWAALDIDIFERTMNGASVGRAFWGLTPVSHKAQASGTATVGDFTAGAERYVRSGVSLYITDSHADTFLSNVFTLLAESRQKTAVVRPAALVECTATVVP